MPLHDDEPSSSWNQTEKDFPTHQLVHEVFEERVRKQPDAIAVTCGEVRLTYRDLNDRANALALRLRRAHHLGPGMLVALMQDRSEQVLISMLAVLKVGAAYVPITPETPDRRLELILRESRSRVVLTDYRYQARLTDVAHRAGLPLDVVPTRAVGDAAFPHEDLEPLAVSVSSSRSLAYVIYTSGTSGRPKGVMVEHRSVVNYIFNVADRLGLSAGDTCSYSTNVSFDLTVTTTLACLALGGHIAVYEGEVSDLNAYRRFLIEHDVTFIKLTPAYFGLAASFLYETNVCTVVLGGEKLGRAVLDRIRTRVDQELKVYDEYGPTEATVGTCAALVYPLPAESKPNIGRLYGNYRAYVLDADLQPVKVGRSGELFIGGIGLARGYLDQPDLTTERFIVDHFSTELRPGGQATDHVARMYRTGDLVRWLPSGELEYLGRNDDQVKIRGFRVELGEVEHALESYGDVDRAAVVAHNVGSRDDIRRLVAYVKAAEFGCSEEALEKYLHETLPEYLVPSTYVFLDELPLTSNGKLDRAALTEPRRTRVAVHVAPRTALERTVTDIWAEVLGLETQSISIFDDFFRRGGDSIIAIQLLSRIHQRLGVHLPIDELLDRSTLEQFCEFLEDRIAKEPVIAAADTAAAAVGELPLLPIQEWFFRSNFARPYHWNQAFLIATPRLDVHLLRECVRELGNRHDAFRLRYRRDPSGTVRQYYAADYQPTDLVISSTTDNASQQAQLTAWQADFNLENGPVYRIGYIDGPVDGSSRVFIAGHHLVLDAVSWRILAEDLESLYHGATLARKGSSYQQWTTAIQQYAPRHAELRDVWERVQPRPEQNAGAALLRYVQNADTKTVSRLTLDTESTTRILHCHGILRTQINDLLLTALAHALMDLTGEVAHHIILEGHGREEIDPALDVGRTVGWFTTMFPVPLRALSDLLATLRETKETLRSIPAKGIGYGALYGYDDTRLPRINFNYLGRLNTENPTVESGRWRLTQDPSGEAVHPENHDNNIVTINGWIADSRLSFTVTNKLGQEAGDYLVQRYEHYLLELSDALSTAPRTFLTPSDVGSLVSAKYLDELQSEREIESVFLANSLQQGFIFQSVTHGRDDDAYIVQMTWDYATHIDSHALHEAWRRAQYAFPALRLRFGWGEEVVQIVDAIGTVDWRYFDLSDEPAEKQRNSIRLLREADRAEPYNLESGCLFRIYLVKSGPELFSCLFSHHHAILDGWSNTVLLNRVHDLYEALIAGLPTDVISDRSYTAGQKYLQEHCKDHTEFWQSHLSQYDERMDLQGLLRVDSRQRGIRVEETRRVLDMQELKFTVSGEKFAALRQATQDSAVTINALILYLWHKTISCYSGAKQSTTGVVVSGRGIPVKDIDTSVGLFINTLPLIASDGADEVTIRDGIQAMQRRINALNAHSTVDLGALRAGADRLFDTLFIYENWPKTNPDGWQSRLSVHMTGEYEKLDYPLSVIVSEISGAITFRLLYASELFDVHIMAGMLEMQRHLLEEALLGLERPWQEIDLLPEARQHEIAATLNPVAENLSSARTLVEVFEEHVRRHPARDAVVFHGVALTYGELNEQSNRMANFLVEDHHVGLEDLVVICLDKGLELIISILAVLKSRASYVLTDPAYPDSRLSYIISDTASRLVITTNQYLERLATLSDAGDSRTILALDELEVRDALATASPAALETYASVDALMYVLYTSGTTGVPKGVMIEHRAYGQTIAGVKARYFPDLESVTTHSLTNPVFDIFGLEYGLPLWTGGTVELSTGIPTSLDCNNLNFIQVTPSVCDVLLDRMVNVPDDLLLLVGGERLPKELLERVLARSIDLVNVYGPTETTIWSTSRLYRQAGESHKLPVSIGVPFAGESVHVLDASFRPLPIGAAGELCIGGDGLARGYLNKSKLTAERFIDVTLERASSEQRSIRLYRTGDLVRLLPSGTLEFIGRNDDQVKINGHRIELGEVENALASHPAVRQSTVIVADLGSATLVGYYVATKKISATDLYEHLRRSLPGYMLPTRCIHLEHMPLTSNGKVDRAALPQTGAHAARVYVPPRSPVETGLCSLIARLLGLHTVDVGIDDDFFQLGGTSLLSVKLVAAAGSELGISTTVEHLLTHRTVRELVENLDQDEKRVVIPPTIFTKPEDQKMSFAQERLWFIDRFEGGTSAYNLPLVLEVANHADTDKLLVAVRHVIARHDALRTLLKETPDGIGYQEVVNADAAVEIEVVRTQSQTTMHDAIRDDLQRVFDLASQVPIRVSLYETPDAGRQLVFVIHHVAFDGWSTDVFVNDLLAAYALFSAASEVSDPLLELPPQLHYRDFATWQREYLSGDRLVRLQKYWRNQLECYQNLNLVSDKPRPDNIDYHGADIRVEVGVDISGQLRKLAKELHVSLFSVLVSAHLLTLRCFSNQDDITVGIPVANRDHPQLANIVGFFVNTLPLRSRIDGNTRISDYVRRTSRTVLAMLRHQELPLEHLLEFLDIERDTSRHPIFQSIFGVQSFGTPAHATDSSGESAPVRISAATQELYTTARFDLSTFIDDSLESLQLHINYATSLFEPVTIRSFADTYLTILRQFGNLEGDEARRRRTTISDLRYVEGDRRHELVAGWSAPRQRFESEVCLHQSVEEHARRRPDHVALVGDERQLTYSELNTEANRLAHFMSLCGGVGPNSVVMLCLDPCEDIVIAILATLKAGASYLPVDPTFPDTSIRYMLADARVRTIVTHSRYFERLTEIISTAEIDLTEFGAIEVVTVDDLATQEILSATSPINPETKVIPSDLAYVLYTTDDVSTKGVPHTHANVARLFAALQGVYQIRENDVWTLSHNYVSEFTVWEMWGALLYGGRLVMPTLEQSRDPERHYALCQQKRVTMMCQTPTEFYQFAKVALEKDEHDRLDDLRYIFFGGESLNASLLTEWFARYSHDRPKLAMGYGTTEATIFTCYKIYSETDEGSADLGSLIPDMAGYVLDAQRRLLPVGAVGELHIGGPGLTPGFLNRPDLTRREFIANPFSADIDAADAEEGATSLSNTRLFQSGDLVRWAPDHTLRFVGNKDLQNKGRGHRIELDKIKTALAQIPGVLQSTIVTQWDDGDVGQYQLVGYYVAEKGFDAASLFKQLQTELPAYMMPAALVPMARLPQKLSGTLDIDALPQLKTSTAHRHVTPRNQWEERAREVLADVLGADPQAISVHDDFFHLGGTSILSIKLASRLSSVLGRDISVASIFRHKSIAGFVDSLGSAPSTAAAILQASTSAETDQVVSFAQERLWFIDRYEHGTDAYNIHLCYEVLPHVDIEILERSFRTVYQRHEALRTVIRQRPDGQLYQSVLAAEEFPLKVRHVPMADRDDLAVDFRAEGRTRFNLAEEAPFRITIYHTAVRGDPRTHSFIGILVHHIAFDGWSADLMLDELNQLYPILLHSSDGEAVETKLPALTVQYRDYAVWERDRISGARLAELLRYWTGHLNEQGLSELPGDRVRPRRMDYRGDRVEFEIDRVISVAVRRLARDSGVGLFSVLLSAYFLTLQVYTGRRDLVVGVPVANRAHRQTQQLIGSFTNSLALDFEIARDEDVEALIKKVGARVAEAQAYQELPFERLVAEMNLPADPSRNPLFQTWFDVNSFAESGIDGTTKNVLASDPLLRTHRIGRSPTDSESAVTSKLDLGLVINDVGDSLSATITYATSIFDHSTVESFASTYQSILTQFARVK